MARTTGRKEGWTIGLTIRDRRPKPTKRSASHSRPAARPQASTPDSVVHLKVGDIMSAPVVTARPNEKVIALARRMNLHRVGCVVVVDQRRVVGVVTERDILRMTAQGQDAQKVLAERILTRPAVCAGLDDEIPEAIRTLVLNNIKKLPILDQGRLVGIVTFSDFAQLAPAYNDFFSKVLGEATRQARARFDKYVHGPADPWTFV